MKHDACLSLRNEIHLHFIHFRKICRIKLYELDAVSTDNEREHAARLMVAEMRKKRRETSRNGSTDEP